MAVDIQRRLFTTTEYEAMLAAGILTPEDRLELIAGEILQMSPLGSRHASVVNRLTRWFSQSLEERAIVAVQNPLRLNDISQPQPDVALLKPRDDFYAAAHPPPPTSCCSSRFLR